MEIIYGNTLADRIKADMKQKIDDIRAEGARLPLLSVVYLMFVVKKRLVLLLGCFKEQFV